MHEPTNASPTATTCSLESPAKNRSFHLRHIYDGLQFPALNLRVCLSGPSGDRIGFTTWLGRAGCRFVDDPLEADFVIFTGGSDVAPALYGENAIAETYGNPQRDKEDIALYDLCVAEGIPMVGICRGAQFLWVMKGGKLFQDVDHHNNGEHDIFVFGENKKYRASSVHHQQCRPEQIKGMKLIANASESKNRKSSLYTHTGPSSDFEIFAFMDDAILGIQGHPEYNGFPAYSDLCARLIDQVVYDNPATTYHNRKVRLGSVVSPLKVLADLKPEPDHGGEG